MLSAVWTGTRTVDGATVRVHADAATLARAAADEARDVMRAAVQARGTAHAMFATGNSQLAFVRALVEETAGVPWADTVVFHMDEYVGVGPDHPAGFQHWIRERIVEPAHPRAAYYVEGLGDAEAECLRYGQLLRSHPLDLCCLGIGENGHLAFNDPPVADFSDRRDVKVVELDAACRMQQVNEGHFAGLDAVPTHAITVTIPALLRGRAGARRRARGAQGRAGAATRSPDRSPPPAPRRHCGRSRTPPSTWTRIRRGCSPTEEPDGRRSQPARTPVTS